MSSRAKKKWRFRQHGMHYELKEKIMSSGVVSPDVAISWDSTRQDKMSRVLLDFVAPYTAAVGSHQEFQRVVLFGLIAWNTALLPEGDREEAIGSLVKEAIPADIAAECTAILGEMVERKQKHFAENRRLILAHHWTMTGKGPHLSVVSSAD